MIRKMNEAGKTGEAFVFVIDFEMKNCIFKPLTALDSSLFYCLKNHIHLPEKATLSSSLQKKGDNFSYYNYLNIKNNFSNLM